ncbi:MAG: MarR family winged helix-turn-helix transcriptional regulator [Burkholderiaceae bacterium]
MAIQHSLEKALPFLLARTGISMGQAFTKQLLPFSISLIEWRVCVTIYETQNSTLSQVAHTCSNDPSTLSRTVNGLIKKGYIKRIQSRLDKRSYVLNLTLKGKQVTEKIIPLAQEYETKALVDFGHEEIDQLRSLLKRIHNNMGQSSISQ